MSIFKKLSNLAANKAESSIAKHPLASAALEFRLQYLSGVALGTAADRKVTEAERQAMIRLANSLSLDTSEADEQLNERSHVTEDGIAVIFDSIQQKQATWLYMLDLLRMHAADQTVDTDETSVANQLANMLGVDTSKLPALVAFVGALVKQDRAPIQKALLNLRINDPVLTNYIALLVQPIFSYAGIISGRYIDHGNGTLTDTTTNLMWLRFCVGQRWEAGKVAGNPSVFSEIDDGEQAAVNFNTAGFAQKSDWRIPTIEEIKSLTAPKTSYPVIDEQAFVSTPAYWYFSSSFTKTYNGRSHQMTGFHNSIRSDDFVLRLCRNA